MILGDDQLGGRGGGRAPGKKRNRLWRESSQGFFFFPGGGFTSVSRTSYGLRSGRWTRRRKQIK